MKPPREPERKSTMGIVLIIIGIACAFYGMTIMLVGSGSKFFLFWYVLTAVLVALGFAVASGAWAGFPVAARRAIQIIGGLFCAFLIVTQFMVASEFNDRGEPGVDYLIVLGAQVRSFGPSIALTSRLDAAYAYLTENEQTMCIVSGGQGPNEPVSEADAMEAYLIERGLDPARIIREDQSNNTMENIRNSMAFIDPAVDHVAIVTNDYHLFRGMAIARKQGIVHVSGIAAGATPWYLPNNMARESFGLAKDFVFGNL